MKKLNIPATRIFCDLVATLNDQPSRKLTAGAYMPLHIKKINENIETPAGQADHYSVWHAHEQNGDLTRDPEMTFLVVDKRANPKDYAVVAIYAASYRQDSDGIDFESIHIKDNRVTNFIPVWQYEHCRFANQWMKHLKAQGFLD